MNNKKSIIIEHYMEKAKDFNIPDYQVLDWESQEAQETRFKAFLDHFDIRKSVLLDVGCGLGNLAEYIDKQNITLYYIGVDIISEMVERAKQKVFKNIIPQFMTMDFFKTFDIEDDFDYIYSSGIFNLNLGNNEEFLANAVRNFLIAARKGVCFNLLDISCKEKYGDKYYYYKKDEIFKMVCETVKELDLKCKIKISDDYLANDFSVFIDFLQD